MSLGVNGEIKVCPQYDAKAPELQKQIDAMQKSLAGNQALLLELTHSARGVNALGKDVDAERQVVLLKSFARQLQSAAQEQAKTQEQIAKLANQLDSVKDMISANTEDAKSAAKTRAALEGRLGDAIAALDLTKAESQLDSIEAEVAETHKEVTETRKNTEEIKDTLKAQDARDLADRKKKAEEEKAIDEDPNMYTRAQIMPNRSVLSGQLKLMVFFYSRPPLYPPFVDSSFSIAFRKGAKAWRVDAKDKQISGGGELWNIVVDDVGDKATFCFVAHDQASGRLKEWMQRYTVTSAGGPQAYNFIPDGQASMRLTDGGACDGVTEAKIQSAEEVPQDSIAKMRQRQIDALKKQYPGTAIADMPTATAGAGFQDRIAALQKQQADMRAAALNAGPKPEYFAEITAEATRKDGENGNRWELKVDVDPGVRAKLYDEHIEVKMTSAAGHVTPLQLSNRTMMGETEIRFAAVGQMGTKATMCLTAKDPRYGKTYKLTQRFSIETTRVSWTIQGRELPGENAAFVASEPPTIVEADGSPCQ